jgi:hypothetical protein
MKISGINKQTAITSRIHKSDKKLTSKPSFKGVESAEHYAMELMRIDNSEAARELIGRTKKYLPLKEVRDFIEGFLKGINNSKNLSEYTKGNILRSLSYNFNDFIYKDDYWFRSEEEFKSHKEKCRYSDIADNEGNITKAAFDTAKKLAKTYGADHYLPDYLKGAKDADGKISSDVGYRVADSIERLGEWDSRSVMKYRIYRDEKIICGG